MKIFTFIFLVIGSFFLVAFAIFPEVITFFLLSSIFNMIALVLLLHEKWVHDKREIDRLMDEIFSYKRHENEGDQGSK